MEKYLEIINKRMNQIKISWVSAVQKKDTTLSTQMWARFQELDVLKKQIEDELKIPKEDRLKIELTCKTQ